MYLRVAAKRQAAVQSLADRRPKENGAGTVCPRDASLWWEEVKLEHTEGDKFNNDAP